ncbi:ABC transporter ATP-binding protein [Swingsia samuiensis]|uniref:ABC transporter ATP-binding protein n=1 Tax=Swingsia samuiensis TaxID=1293412 RepID=A0A4Y6UGJ4_9PROT|nr:ABC transporter ATP-binding protein [Swingsia samuiensis]QDH16692.1 ABC transporter ATP-binding protein [Swingsia samuiensis]
MDPRGVLLSIEKLGLSLANGTRLLEDVSFEVKSGQTVGVVGESGSGKSLTALSVMGLLPHLKPAGHIHFDGQELVGMPDRMLRKLRGLRIAMIFQDPMTAFLPVRSIGAQIDEQIRLHEKVTRKAARQRTVSLLEKMGVPEPWLAADRYPHQLSGGLRQRAMIAMALSCAPDLLIADEPTTALDVTVQAQILALLHEIRNQGAGVMLITHDMGVVAQSCTTVAVMYSGQVVETGPVRQVLEDPLHPYTKALLAAIPPLEGIRPDKLPTIIGSPPSPVSRPEGCVFGPRCSFFKEVCALARPELKNIDSERRVACVLYSA